jgi:hypothetical protein
MKSVVRGALFGALFAVAWIAATAGPELSGQNSNFIIGFIGAPILVCAILGAAIGGILSAISRA